MPFGLSAVRSANQSSGCYCDLPGFRNNGSGALTNVGNQGFSWSSTVSGINGMDLNFNNGNLNPSNRDNRAHGFQVRCLQAFIGTLIFISPTAPGRVLAQSMKL